MEESTKATMMMMMVWEATSCVVEGRQGMDRASHWLMEEWDDSYKNYMELLISQPPSEYHATAVASYMLLCTMLHRKLQQSSSSSSSSSSSPLSSPPPIELLSCLSQALSLHHHSNNTPVSSSSSSLYPNNNKNNNNNKNEQDVILPLCYCYASTWVYHYYHFNITQQQQQKKQEELIGILSNHLPSLTILLRVWQCVPHELDIQMTTNQLLHRNTSSTTSFSLTYSSLLPFTFRLMTYALQQQLPQEEEQQQTVIMYACRNLSHWSSHISYRQLFYYPYDSTSSPGVLHQCLISSLATASTIIQRGNNHPQTSSSSFGCVYYIANIFTDIISNIYSSNDKNDGCDDTTTTANNNMTSLNVLERECQVLFSTFQQAFLHIQNIRHEYGGGGGFTSKESCLSSLANACIAILTNDEIIIMGRSSTEWWEFAIQQLQLNPQINIAMDTLDVWLTLQDLSNDERPYFLQSSKFLPHVLTAILQRLSYHHHPSPTSNDNHHYHNNDEEDDEDDYNQFKSLSIDVFIALLYGLSVPTYLDICCGCDLNNNNNNSSSLINLETRIFSINCVSSQLLSLPQQQQQQQISPTLQSNLLPQIFQFLTTNNNISTYTSCTIQCVHFLGIYSSLWKYPSSSAAEIPFQNIVTCLTQLFLSTTSSIGSSTSSKLVQLRMEIAKTIQKFCTISVSSSSSSNPNDFRIDPNVMQSWVQSSLQPPTNGFNNSWELNYSGDEDVDGNDSWQRIAETIIQACIPYILHTNNNNKEWYQTIILNPLWQYTTAPPPPPHTNISKLTPQQSLVRYGKLWKQVIVSTDVATRDNNNNIDMMQTTVLPIVWQLLSSYTLPTVVATTPMDDDDNFLPIWITLHVNILSHVPFEQVQEITNRIISSYIQTYEPCLLDYISSVVEFHGSSDPQKDMFPPLWIHLFTHTCTHLTTTTTSSSTAMDTSELVGKFFIMAKRFWTFCPNIAVTMTKNIDDLWICIMTCLSNVENNDWDATRAILQFISTLLPVYYPSEPYGYTLINACITALTTGQSVSMLVPAYSECLLSLILNNTQISQEWVHRVILSLSSSPSSSSLSTEDHTKVQTIVRPVMEILFPMVAKDGQSSKPRAKMLINDMSKIFNGEITLDCLLTYSL